MPPRLTELPLLRRLKPGLHVHDEEALNAEPDLGLLDAEITPTDAFFIRNNGTMPEPLGERVFRLTVDGEVERPEVFTLAALKGEFETVSVTAVLECAGNGRSLFVPPTDGLPWRLGAVGCAVWTGVRMGDVLRRCGLSPRACYTGHEAPDRLTADERRPALSRGLPIAKALAPETLLAFAMNGEPLPRLHGGPLRVVAPGFPGSAWQKWLTRLRVRDCEHDGEKMGGTNYRMPAERIAPGAAGEGVAFSVITDMPVKSLVTSPLQGFAARPGEPFAVRGFAWSGEVPVACVEVSGDDGRSWREAPLGPARDRFAWRRFETAIVPEAGPVAVLARAVDAAGRAQPLGSAPWNPRGYLNNAVQRVLGVAR